MNNKSICLDLVKSDSEAEVISILDNLGFWTEPNHWRYYGDKENNFSTIGNQQSSADTALVEKLVNFVDAVLMRECLRCGILIQKVLRHHNHLKMPLQTFLQ